MNISKTGGFQEIHDHLGNRDAFISGSYYGKVPENSGNIYFESPIVGSHLSTAYCLGDSTNDLAEVKTEEGLLLLFPSWLRHGVRLNNSKDTRVSVSFNVGVNPK